MTQEKLNNKGRIITSREFLDNVSFIYEGGSSGVGQDMKFFVGQEKPRREFTDVINQSQPGTVVIISEPLGAGKSFLINTVLRDLDKIRSDKYFRTSAYRLERDMEDLGSTPPKAIFIEEFDRKLPFAELQQKMKLIAEITKRKESVVVLSGDHSLRNSALIGLINSQEEPVRINMDTLNTRMLKKAFELRLCEALDEKVGAINVDGLFDREFLKYLIPNTSPSISTMRTSFAILTSMASVSTSSDSPATFSGELYRKLRGRREHGFDLKTWHFVSWLHAYIRNHDPNVPMEALGILEFIKLYGLDEISEGEFPEILEDLARHNVLKSVGVPYLQDKENSAPEPYLPSQETFLDSMFYPLPQNTPTEQLEIDEVAFKKAQLERLNNLLQDRHITQAVFHHKRNEILELDELIGDYVDGRISRQVFETQKQNIEKKYL